MRLEGELILPGDKSITHRALMLAALASGESRLYNWPPGQDVRSTLKCLRQCGLEVLPRSDRLVLRGSALQDPSDKLQCGNSGTTIRLLLGLLAGQGIAACFDGDGSLRARPLARVIEPLGRMGAQIAADRGKLPVSLIAGRLTGQELELEVASAQVKSALLFAALGAEGSTTVREKLPTRDHTELLFRHLDLPLESQEGVHRVQPLHEPVPTFTLELPGDPSTAAPFVTGCALLPGSSLLIRGMLLNRTRIRYLDLLQQMGLKVEQQDEWLAGGETAGTLLIKSTGELQPFTVTPEEVPLLIDELPLLAVAATAAQGTSRLTGAAELRVKESDRLALTCANLRRLGADVEEQPDGFEISGGKSLTGGTVATAGDHRMVMAMRIAGLISRERVVPEETASLAVSCPFFDRMLSRLIH